MRADETSVCAGATSARHNIDSSYGAISSGDEVGGGEVAVRVRVMAKVRVRMMTKEWVNNDDDDGDNDDDSKSGIWNWRGGGLLLHKTPHQRRIPPKLDVVGGRYER